MNEQAKDSVFLLGGARFKLSFQDIHCAECGAEHDKVTVEPLGMYASDLQGKWVALVPAENDAHLYLEELKQQRDELLAAAKKMRPFIEEGEVPQCFWSEPFKSALAEFDAAIEKAK